MRPAALPRITMLAVFLVAFMATCSTAGATSVAYIDNGEVWLSSLDGTSRARLAATVLNGDGDTEKWLDVAQSDNGRIVAVRNKPGRVSSFSWFKIWEPDGTSTVEGALNAPPGWTTYVYPLGFDITADGKHLVYGYSNQSGCCPISSGRGTYVRLADSAATLPIVTSGQTYPSLFGNRIVAVQDAGTPSIISAQDVSSGDPYGTAFTPWLDTSGVGLELRRADIAANGQLATAEFETWDGGTQTVGKIAVLTIQGIDQTPVVPAAVDCFLPAAGVASDVSLSQDAQSIAWKDTGGVKVAGAPTTSADPCVLPSGPVTISPTGAHPSIGAADVATFLPKTAAPPVAVPAVPSTPPGSPSGKPAGGATTPVAAGSAPVLTLPAKVTTKALAASGGVKVKIRVGAAGRVAVLGTVAAKRLGRRGKAIVVVTGATTAKAAGTVTVRLRLTAVGRKRVSRLKGARVTLSIVQGARRTTKVITLR
ncbi:MAG TPA: hypothetical protein VFY45_25025 [Baekduia sp.]|nr:hypothetical protein [Baekduia sp.]